MLAMCQPKLNMELTCILFFAIVKTAKKNNNKLIDGTIINAIISHL